MLTDMDIITITTRTTIMCTIREKSVIMITRQHMTSNWLFPKISIRQTQLFTRTMRTTKRRTTMTWLMGWQPEMMVALILKPIS